MPVWCVDVFVGGIGCRPFFERKKFHGGSTSIGEWKSYGSMLLIMRILYLGCADTRLEVGSTNFGRVRMVSDYAVESLCWFFKSLLNPLYCWLKGTLSQSAMRAFSADIVSVSQIHCSLVENLAIRVSETTWFARAIRCLLAPTSACTNICDF